MIPNAQKAYVLEILDGFEKYENVLAAKPEDIMAGNVKPDVRRFADMKEVLMDQSFKGDWNWNSYYMYRAIAEKQGIRYDITAIPSVMVSREFNKTYGHYHPIAMGSRELTYPEVYQVLYGSATYVLQKKDIGSGLVSMVDIVRADIGDIVYIPPNYGHVTVNTGDGILIMANLVASSFKSSYEDYKRKKGAAVYVTDGGIIDNHSYMETFSTNRHEGCSYRKDFVAWAFGNEKDILGSLNNNADKLGFINIPVE